MQPLGWQIAAELGARDNGGGRAPPPPTRGRAREQRERLDALQRLCDQGTVTAAECAAKRGAILRGDP